MDAKIKAKWDLDDAVRKADEALKEAIAERVRLGNQQLIQQLKDFATWVPEGFPGVVNNHTGELLTDEEKAELKGCPFLTETYLYYLLGKEDARSLLAYFGSICRAVGVESYHDLQEEFFKEQDEKEKAEEDRVARMRANAVSYEAAGHTFLREGPCPVCKAAYTEEELSKGGGNPNRCRHWTLRRIIAEIKAETTEKKEDPS